jgi:ribosomal protein S18 acetylase RimI-like enzyme
MAVFHSQLKYTCRQGLKQDAEEIHKLMQDAFADYVKSQGKEEKVVNSALKEDLSDIYDDLENNIVMVLLDNNKVIASLRLEEVSDKRFLLKRFAVAPNYQDHGLGSMLFERAVEKLIQIGARYVQLYSSLENVKLVNFYKGLGFNCLETDHKKGYERGLWVKKIK